MGSEPIVYRYPGKTSRFEKIYADECSRVFDCPVWIGQSLRSDLFTARSTWSADIFLTLPDERVLVVEYDGSYWHRDKVEIDRAKTVDLLSAGYIVVRIREQPLPDLHIGIHTGRYYELASWHKVHNPAMHVEWIRRFVFGLWGSHAPLTL